MSKLINMAAKEMHEKMHTLMMECLESASEIKNERLLNLELIREIFLERGKEAKQILEWIDAIKEQTALK